MGYYYADSLFIGPNNLIVEGVTDWWILDAVSKHFVSAGKEGLPPRLALPPVDGATKVPTMAGLLTAQKLIVMALLDDDGQGRSIRDEMLKSRLLRDEQVILVSEAFDLLRRPKQILRTCLTRVFLKIWLETHIQRSFKARRSL